MRRLRADFNALRSTASGRYDPIRLRYIEGMLQRCERSDGALSDVLAQRIEAALDSYRAGISARPTVAPAGDIPATAAALGELREQLAELADFETASGLDNVLQQQEMAIVAAAEQPGDQLVSTGAAQDLRAARRVHATLVRLNAERVLERARAEIPAEAGPLNPQRLASDSLQTMNSLSPHYLTRLVSYLETLLWLEQAGRDR